MENCFVKKFKGSVNTDLPKLGECRFKVVNGSMILQIGNIQSPITISGKGGVLLDGQSTKVISTGGWTSAIQITGLPTDTTVGEISIPDKYVSVNAVIAPMVGNDLSPFGGIEMLQFSYTRYANARATDDSFPTLSNIVKQFPHLTLLGIGGKGASGDVTELLPLADTLTSLEASSVVGVLQSDIRGDFAELGKLYKLTALNSFLVNSKVSGTVEGFVANRLQVLPATAGSITAKWIGDGNRIKYNGEPLSNVLNTTISWDAQGNITITH